MQPSHSSSFLGPGGLDIAGGAFFTSIHDAVPASSSLHPHTKISVIGTGNVGMAIAQTILTQDLADELALVDAIPDKLRGEMLDLQHAAAFLPRTKITNLHGLCRNCGVRSVYHHGRGKAGGRGVEAGFSWQECGLVSEDRPPAGRALARWDSVGRFQSRGCFDVCCLEAVRVSAPNQVIGSGTNLDSSRFRFLIADHLDVNAQDVQAYIIGEHGDSSVALWSSISVGGVPILSFLENRQIPYEKQTLENIHKEVVNGAHEVIKLKGYTSWAIGCLVASLARSILRDQRRIHPVSVLAKGFHEIDGGDVFLSLPALLGRGGVHGVTNIHMTEEIGRLRSSAKIMLEVQDQLRV